MATRDGTRPVGAWRRVVERAVQAPSLHNSQPWHFELRDGALDVYADRRRQLQVLDPRGRQLHISCGCAVLNARVALAAAGVGVDVERLSDVHRPHLVARLVPTDGPGDPALARLDGAIDTRRTNRRRFTDEDMDASVVAELAAAARQDGAELVAIVRDEHRSALARLSQLADRYELADPAYRAELRRWTTDDPRRDDGVSARAVPAVDGSAQDEIPLRDFDSAGMAWLPGETRSSSRQCLLLLTTSADDEAAWVRAGEALERVLLELADRGYATSPLTQVIEVRQTHELLRAELGFSGHPQLLLRVGRAAAVAPTRRRPLEDVLTVVS
jgi:nitroreductase